MPNAGKGKRKGKVKPFITGEGLGVICRQAKAKVDRQYLAQHFLELPTAMNITIYKKLKTPDDFRQAYRNKHLALGGVADKLLSLMSRHDFPKMKPRVEIVAISLKDLTGKEEATFREVLEASFECSGSVSSIRLWANARLQYLNQPIGECLYCGANFMFGPNDLGMVLTLENLPGVGKWLAAEEVDLTYSIDGQQKRVFPGDSIWLIPRQPLLKITT